MSLTRVLFVDDEIHVLDGLQNLLRKQRHVWDMVFALDGPSALAELEKTPFNVIVSDMRMPGMDGATLLEKVKDRYPSVARIVLSGHAEQEAVVRALPVAHQFLSKPCDADVLRDVIERTCNLQALLRDDAVRQIVGRLDKLPSVPQSYVELTQATTRANVSLAEIAGIIERDPAMSAKVLQLVNSAYFGLARPTMSIQHAVMCLGVELIKGLALTTPVFAIAQSAPKAGLSLDHLQKASVLTARLARRIVIDQAQGEGAFTAGVVHDIGKIILALALPDRFAAALRAARESGQPFHAIERDALGVTHAEVGAYLLGAWGLPFPIVEAVAFHHTPRLVTAGARDLVAAVHVAGALIDRAFPEEHVAPSDERLDTGFLETLGCVTALPSWRQLAKNEVDALEMKTH